MILTPAFYTNVLLAIVVALVFACVYIMYDTNKLLEEILAPIREHNAQVKKNILEQEETEQRKRRFQTETPLKNERKKEESEKKPLDKGKKSPQQDKTSEKKKPKWLRDGQGN